MIRFIGFHVVILAVILIRFMMSKRLTSRTIYNLWIMPALYLMLTMISFPIPAFFAEGINSAGITAIRDITASTIDIAGDAWVENNGSQSYGNSWEQIEQQNERVPVIIKKVIPAEKSADNGMGNAIRFMRNDQGSMIVVLRYVRWIVAVALLMYVILCNLHFLMRCYRLRTFCGIDTETGMKVYQLPFIKSPFLFGVSIYIPEGLSKNKDVYRFAVHHEYCHLRQMDPLRQIAKKVILCLYWFDPVIWISARLMEKDAELSCDEAVIRTLGNGVRYEYGKAIVDLLQTTSKDPLRVTISTGMGGTHSVIKERIIRIVNESRKSKILTVIVILAITIITAAAVLMNGTVSDAQTSGYSISKSSDEIIVNETTTNASEFSDTKIRQENENISTWEKYTYHPERNMMNAALFYRDEWYHALDGTLHCINTHTGKDRFEEESFSKQSGIIQLGNIEGEWLFFGKDLWNKNEDSGIYQFNIMTGENCKLVALEDIGYIPVIIYTKDSVLYLQGEQADQLQCYSIEKGSGIENNSKLKNNSEMGENVKMRLQRIQRMIPVDELNPTALYSLLEYGYAAYPSYQNNVVYVYEDEKQDVTVIDNVKANVSVTHKGVIYTDMDNNIHLLDRAGTDTILYAYESQTGFLNYGNYDEGGIFVCSESDTGVDIYYITWDGMKNLLVHCNGARLGTDLWLSSGNDYYSYFRNGEFVISKKILYSDAY